MASDPLDIVVLGASIAGVGISHYILKYTLPQLKNGSASEKYRLVLVSPSTHYFHRVGSPRGIIAAPGGIPDDKLYYSLAEAFAQYPKESFELVVGTATAVDPDARTVTVLSTASSGSKDTKTIPYHGLVIATGASTPWSILSPIASRDEHAAELASVRKQIASARSFVIGGGGPVGVEIAGEIGAYFTAAGTKADITLVTADDRLLTVLRPTLGAKAASMLSKLGVHVRYSTRVVSSTTHDKGGADVVVRPSSGAEETLSADLYIPATGLTPNTSFLPPAWVDPTTRRATNDPSSLRLADRVFVIGDAGAHSQRGGVFDVNAAVPVVATNILRDLLRASPTPALQSRAAPSDRAFTSATPPGTETMVVPVGKGGGVGAFGGWKIPSLGVWAMKGRDYFVWMQKGMTVGGGQWRRESKWTPPHGAGAAGDGVKA